MCQVFQDEDSQFVLTNDGVFFLWWQENGEKTHEETKGEGGGGGGGIDHKLRDDMELVLAALVDFRRDMKALSKRVQVLTDNDGHKPTHTTTKTHPGFLE